MTVESGKDDFRKFKKRCRKWLAKAYSRATTQRQFRAIANLAEILEITEEASNK